jgi:hypothetical protein
VTNVLSGANVLDALLVNGTTSLNAQIAGYNTILWTGVTIGPGTAALRITNVRVDASLLATRGLTQSVAVTGQVSVNIGADLPVTYAAENVGCSAGGSVEILGCANVTLVFQKGQPSSATGGAQTIIPLVYQEAALGVFHAGGTAPTRLRLVLKNVPNTVSVFAPVYPTEGQGFAQLYSADANGAGGTPVTGTQTVQGIYQQLTVTGGMATATWVVLSTLPNQIETWTFPLLLNNATNNDLTNIQIVASLAPVSDVSVASALAKAPLPRYRDFSVPQKLVNLRVTVVSSTVKPAVGHAAGEVHLTPRSTTVSGNVTSTVQILNDTSDPTQVATNVTVRGNVSGASVVGCTASGSGQCAGSGGGADASYGSLAPGEMETVTITEQPNPGAGGVGNTAYAGADETNADLNAATGSTYVILNGEPIAVSSQPATGGGTTQSFTFQFAHPDGWQNFGVVNILVNTALDGRRACYMAYSVPATALYLVDDGGDAGGPFAGSVVLGSSAVIQNSQCAVSLASAVGSGTTLTLTLNITFQAGFGGNKVFYVAAGDQSGGNSNWQALGVWQVPSSPPTGTIGIGGLSSGHMAGLTGTLQVTVADTKGAGDIGIVDILINGAIDGRHACYLAYAMASNTLFLVDDAGDAGGPFAGGMVLVGGSGTIQNSQCQVLAFGSSAQTAGNRLTLTLNLSFFGGFGGNQIVYVAGRDQASGNNTDWQSVGTWSVP